MDGLDASANKFSVPEALHKCSPTSFSKVKFTEDTWKIQFHEQEDRDVFFQVLNRAVSFHGDRLRVRNWVVSYTPKALWGEAERLADAANQNYDEGLGGSKCSQQNAEGVTNSSNK